MSCRESVLLIASAFAALAAQNVASPASGYWTDTLSGKSGANALNVEMAKRNVDSGKAS
jgi:hypothetical protein